MLWLRVHEADCAAADCWMALLANCDSPGRRALPTRLRALSDAAAAYAGAAGSSRRGHRRRVDLAEHQLVEAMHDSDGEDFAEAFVGYDQAVATTVIAVQSRLGSPA